MGAIMKNKAIKQIRSASREMVRQLGLLDNRFSSIGSVSQCHAMVELDTHGAMTIKQLSAALNLEKSTMSRLITQMIEKEVCFVQVDKDDQRNKLVSLTNKGTQLVAHIHHQATSQVEQALNMMTKEEQDIVVRGLSLYAQKLKQSNPTEDVL